MRVEGYQIPRSSFLSTEKDMNIIIDEMFRNKRLKKLLYYTTPDALTRPDIPQEKVVEMMGKNIKTVPKLIVDKSVLNYVIVSFDNFTQGLNPQFRDNIVEFDIICHFDQWQLNDLALRPYKIAAEIDTMFNMQRLTGIGKLEFLGAKQMILSDEFAGLCLMYNTVHGEEDKKHQPNPADEEQYLTDFRNYVRS